MTGVGNCGSGAFENRTDNGFAKLREASVIQCARTHMGVPREKSFSREARSKNRYAWIYRARKFRARRNVRVIPDHFEQNGHYDPVLIVTWRTYRFPVRRRCIETIVSPRLPRASLFRNGVCVTCAVVTTLRQ